MMWLFAFFCALGEMLADAGRFVAGKGCARCGSRHTTVQLAGKDRVHHICAPCWKEM